MSAVVSRRLKRLDGLISIWRSLRMGSTEGVHPAKLLWDDRYAEWRESQRSSAKYVQFMARKNVPQPHILAQVAQVKERRRKDREADSKSRTTRNKSDAEPVEQHRGDAASWPYPIPDDKVTTTVNVLPPCLGEPPAQAPESLLVRRARERHWRLAGAEATAEPGATLSGLAEAITGHAEDWKLLDFPRDPGTLRVGDTVNVMPLLEKAAGMPVQKQPQKERAPVPHISPPFVRKVAGYIADWEGRRTKAYPDKKGIMTVGVGFNLEARREEFEKLLPGVSYEDLIAGKIELTEAQVDLLFANDVREDIRKATAAVPDFDGLPQEVRLVLVDMCHQFGSPWPKLNASIRRKDYREVAKQIWSDRWVEQTERRALHHIEVIREWVKREQERQKDNAGPLR